MGTGVPLGLQQERRDGLYEGKENANPQISGPASMVLPPCPTLRRLASSTNTRHVQNVYNGRFNIPVQPHASQTPQSAVRIHHFDHHRVTIATQIITQDHPIPSVTCNEFSHPRHLMPTFCGEPPRSRPERTGELDTINWVYFNR